MISIFVYFLALLSGLAQQGDTGSFRIEGDVYLGFLLPISQKMNGFGCEITEHGIQLAEMALMTVDLINQDSNILPGIALGVDVRDTCEDKRMTLKQTISFIHDAFGQESDHPTCRRRKTNLAAIIGPENSRAAMDAQRLLQVFQIPQIGYSTTAKDLSDKAEFSHLMRLVPSDKWKSKALVEIVKHFGWSHVAVLYSDDEYGKDGFEELQRYIGQTQICIVVAEKLGELTDEEMLLTLTKVSESLPNPKVVISFCKVEIVRQLFEVVKRYKQSNCDDVPVDRRCDKTQLDFQWILSETLSNHPHVESSSISTNTNISLRIYSPSIPSFDQYYDELTPDRNVRNPFFKEFWEQKFDCSFQNQSEVLDVKRKCTGQEKLTANYEQDPQLRHIMNSIYTVAYGLHSMHQTLCRGHHGVCSAMIPVNGSLLFEHMLNVSFIDKVGKRIMFEKNGDPLPRYDVLEYQANTGYVKLGEYYDNSLKLRVPQVKLENDTTLLNCRSFGFLEKKEIQPNRCCWQCVSCEELIL